MKKANLLLLWCLLGIAIIVVSTNGFQLRPSPPITLPDSVAGQALFVCPAASAGFESVAKEISVYGRALSIAFMFLVFLWIAITGWVVYNSLLNDKFERKSYDIPIFLGKFLLFSFVLATVLMKTPNHFRRVFVSGAEGAWILCESDTPGAKAVRSGAVFSGGK
ncbi:MAG: hypothetical protein LBL21_03330 [Rickettsiales bacterium]|jgi:uncharacterized protein with PQ loop repeat|nr:hypothetical protein [Rickettsiales bacterium]